MKRSIAAITLCLACTIVAQAQQPAADQPATKEDIAKYLEVTHAREIAKQMMDVMAQQARLMTHDMILKQVPKVPPEVEARMTKMTDDMLKDLPIDEMLEAMIPAYQKYWTKGDVEAMVAFYSTPTGQKILKNMPATMGEAMQAMQPILQKQMKAMMDRVQEEIAKMSKDSNPGPLPAPWHPLAPIRVGGKVQAQMLNKRVEPVYPPDVQTEGTVQLHAIIGTDGSVLSVEYRSGPSELVQAAMDAVRQWRYRSFLLNGERVEVDTTIEVTFERPK